MRALPHGETYRTHNIGIVIVHHREGVGAVEHRLQLIPHGLHRDGKGNPVFLLGHLHALQNPVSVFIFQNSKGIRGNHPGRIGADRPLHPEIQAVDLPGQSGQLG